MSDEPAPGLSPWNKVPDGKKMRPSTFKPEGEQHIHGIKEIEVVSDLSDATDVCQITAYSRICPL